MSVRLCVPAVFALFLTAAPAPGQAAYKIFVKELHIDQGLHPHDGKPALLVKVQFKIERLADGQVATDVQKDEIIVEEDRRRVTELDIFQPRSADPLTVVLVLDTSGSMSKDRKLDEAREAARVFFQTLHPNVDCGLI